MAIEQRETFRGGPDGADDGPASPSRRFARLVELPGSRRVAPRRLAGALGASVIGLAVIGFGGGRLLRSAAGWVGLLPEHQLPFSRIELIPPPPPYIRGGAEGFLERVQVEAGRDDSVRLLSLKLDELCLDFIHSPWVKGVTRVERSPGRLAVHLTYREPVAVAGIDRFLGVPIDEEGVILPREDRDTDWIEKGPSFRVAGLGAPLIEIQGISRPAGTFPGVPWKRNDIEPDLLVRGAARLARFLRGHEMKTPGGRAMPRLVRIVPSGETPEYYLFDAENRCIFWGGAPDSEGRGLPKADAKWSMLRAWIDEHGSLPSREGEYLTFGHSGAWVGRMTRPARPRNSMGG